MIQKDLQGNLWNCQIKEALKDIPTIKSDLPISAYGSIDLDELNKTVERLNKIPNYDDLMKENNKLQSNCETLNNRIKELEQINEEHRKLNGQLRDNWDSLREWLEENYKFSQDIWYVKIINKMKDLEGVSNEDKI